MSTQKSKMRSKLTRKLPSKLPSKMSSSSNKHRSINYRDIITKSIRNSIKKTGNARVHKINAITVNSNEFKSSDPNIFLEYAGNDKMIPKFKVINSPAYAAVIISLKEGQSIFSNYGTLNYIDSSIDVSTKSNGIISGIIRSLFTTASFFQTYYTGTHNNQATLALSSYIPGDIIAMHIKPGEHYVISQFGFLAASANIKIQTTSRFKNIIMGEDIFLK